jgi:hypothetical protein
VYDYPNSVFDMEIAGYDFSCNNSAFRGDGWETSLFASVGHRALSSVSAVNCFVSFIQWLLSPLSAEPENPEHPQSHVLRGWLSTCRSFPLAVTL